MNRSINNVDAERRLHAEGAERLARNSFDDSVISDDDIPWDQIMADLSAGERGIDFEPEHLLKWAEEDEDED